MLIEQTVRFVIEVAKDVGEERCKFFDQKEYDLIQKIYGSQSKFRTMGDQIVKNNID